MTNQERDRQAKRTGNQTNKYTYRILYWTKTTFIVKTVFIKDV